MSGHHEGGWTVVLLRQGGLRSYSWRLGRPLTLLAGGAAVLALLLVGGGAGLLWGLRIRAAETARQRERIATLVRDQSRIATLAARLDSMTRAYGQLRKVMGGSEAASDEDIRLPPATPEEEAPAPSVARAAPDGLDWPLAQKGFVTRVHQEGGAGGSEGHPGIDIAVPTGSYVRAAARGVVAEVGDDPVYGHFVRIRHGGGVMTLYAHNLWLFVARGDSVERDEVIALSGSSGRSTAPHLHFEVTKNGRSVDPARLLPSGE
jgi:murein DD-endopeptidase MepM/ murein hydrolase activator NlpD